MRIRDDALERIERRERGRLGWTDSQGDRFLIEPEETVADASVIAAVLVGMTDGDEAACWITREQARDLRDWLTNRLLAASPRKEQG